VSIRRWSSQLSTLLTCPTNSTAASAWPFATRVALDNPTCFADEAAETLGNAVHDQRR
jgi:hypothetical protein